MANKKEIDKVYKLFKQNLKNLILLHCVSSYPCPNNQINLPRLEWLSSISKDIGFSDHTKSTIIPALSVAYGVTAIEKHFTTDNNLPGRDNENALEPTEFKLMVKNILEAQQSMISCGNDYQDIESDTVQNYRGRWEPHDYE